MPEDGPELVNRLVLVVPPDNPASIGSIRDLSRAERLVRRFGWGAILIGRFIPAIRSLVPAITGVSGFPRARYSAFDLVACMLWSAGLALILTGVGHLS